MPTIPEAIAIAVQQHQAGRLIEAEQIYRQILGVDPNHVDALHLLGVVLHQIDQRIEASQHIQRAIQLNGGVASFHNSLGNALKAHGKYNEAAAAYRRAIELQPDYAEAHNHLGNTLRTLGQLDEAIAAHRRAFALKPNYAEAYNNLGNALVDQKKYDEAVIAYRRALELKPTFVEAHNNLGSALKNLGNLDDAIAAFQRALELNPQFVAAHSNLGNAFKDQQRFEDAIACHQRAIELNPINADGYNGLATTLQEQGKLDEAIAYYHRALELRPDYCEALNNLGNTFTAKGRLEDAIRCFRNALRLKPDFAEAHINLGATLQVSGKWEEAVVAGLRSIELMPNCADAHMNLAHAWLLLGDWPRGWQEYEWRWKTKAFSVRRFEQPLWEGEPLAGKTILLHAEQGLGDTIQFVRFASILKQQGATVIVECQPALLRLLASCPGVDRWIGQGEAIPAFDVHSPLLSVPRLLKTNIDTIPAQVPYIHPPEELIKHWRDRLKAFEGFKVGINWQGNPKLRFDRFRSIPLRYFAPLGQLPGVKLLSLQKGAGVEQLAEIASKFTVMNFAADLDQASGPFVDTMAVMKGLDLIITSDTATAHLAGALGMPVWVALPFAPDWRWLRERSDSPWYPTMRLFRQTELGNWESALEKIGQALCERLTAN